MDAAIALVRRNGYCATSVDELCAEAGVTKGAFFHHFASKQELGVAAANHWSSVTGALFENATYHQHPDAAQRVLGYVALRKEILRGDTSQFTCFAGTMAQELHLASPEIRQACRESIFNHAATLEADIALALEACGNPFGVTPSSVALHTQAVLQGAFILAKADGGPQVAADSVDHLARYLRILFNEDRKEMQ